MNLKRFIYDTRNYSILSSKSIENYVLECFIIDNENKKVDENIWSSIFVNVEDPVSFIIEDCKIAIRSNMSIQAFYYLDVGYRPVSNKVKSSVLNSLLKTGL